MAQVTVRSEEGFLQEIIAGTHSLLSDEPCKAGGADAGPDPYQLLLGALGACTSITLRMYADRKGWTLGRVRVELEHRRIHARDCSECDTNDEFIDSIHKRILLSGNLSPEQVERLAYVAGRCPVNQTLQRQVQMTESVELESESTQEDFPGQA